MSKPSECYTYATVYATGLFSVVLVAESMADLAIAWKAIAGSKLDPSKVNNIEIRKA